MTEQTYYIQIEPLGIIPVMVLQNPESGTIHSVSSGKER